MDKNKRSVLLLSPWQMGDEKAAINLLVITKKNSAISYQDSVLTSPVVRKEFKDYPQSAKELLMSCCIESIAENSAHVRKRFNLQSGDDTYKAFARRNSIRYWHKIFTSFRPYFPLVKWYYRKRRSGTSAYLTAPCTFSTCNPTLEFGVNKVDNALTLDITVILGGTAYPLGIFERTYFLLESKNEYFILGYQDYQTLEQLAQIDMPQYAHSPDAFARNILVNLEKNYKVSRNGHFHVEEITVKPVNRLLLSELSNAFLMLTPQWLYDGVSVEGEWAGDFSVTKDGVTCLVKRNKEKESEFVQTLVELHPNFANQRNGYYYLSFADAQKKQWFLKVYHRLLQMDIEIVGMDMLKHFRYSPHQAKTVLKLVEEKEHILLYEMEVWFGTEKVPLNELQRMLLAGQKAVLLKDGSLGVPGETWLQQYSSLIKHGKVKNNTIELLRWMAVAESDTPESPGLISESIKQNWWKKWKQWQTGTASLYPLSPSVGASLRPYQQKGYEWLLLLNEIGAGGCLADDMGLGKTLQAICAIMHFVDRHPQSKSIVICPASLVYNWQQEFERFTPGLRTLVYHGPLREKEQITQTEIQVIITTYHTMRADAEWLCDQMYGVAVIDESHNIKNPLTQIAQAVMQLRANFRLALSGTPVVNNTFDLYTQLNFVVPGLFGTREFFKREYADPIDNRQDEEKIASLKKLTAPFVLRRTKEQVAKDLPDKTESILWCEMNGSQRGVYEDILQQTRNSIFLEIQNHGLAKSKFSILQGMMKLRQVCSSPLLLPEQEPRCSESVKMEVLMDELGNLLSSHKALVFSQFSSMLHLLANECKKRGFSFYHFDGQTPAAKRTEMVNAFQEEDNTVHLFLISLKAGNTGLTLTSADYVFLFDPWWNTAVETQAIDRTHRIGQTKNVFAYKMICKDSIEEKIITLQQKKKKLSEELISADESFAKSLTEEDVQYLFS